MKPASKPQITKAEAVKLLKAKGVDTSLPAILAIRGYYLDSMGKPAKNDRGIYDDAIVVVSPSVFKTFNANTDPSTHRTGIAVLKPGVWLYQQGKHKGQYAALRQAQPVTVVRDGKGNDTGLFGINIHKGSQNSTSSLGCQTIHPDQWGDFKGTVYAIMDAVGMKKIPYCLVTEEWRRDQK